MRSRFEQLLFPEQFRDFPHRRVVLNLLRAGHILCFAILLGGIYFKQDASLLTYWIIGVIGTGLAMLSIQLYSSFIALFEIQTIAVLIKVLLLRFIPMLEQDGQLALMMFIILFSSMTSHASRRFRHTSIMSAAFHEKYGFKNHKPRKQHTPK